MPMINPLVQAARRVTVRRVALISLLLVVSTVLLGCQPLIEVVQPVPPVVSPLATVAPDERGIAVMGIDFDPPLEPGQLLASGGVTLLVAVENQGRVAEPSVRVTARLFDPDSSTELAKEIVTVKALAPGELRVVRFTQVTELPIRERYKLLVEVAPVAGERETIDNVKTYDILVRDSE